MTRRQGYIAFCTIGMIVGLYVMGRVITWGLAKWDWWFLVPWIAGCFIIAALIDAVERRNRRRGQID